MKTIEAIVCWLVTVLLTSLLLGFCLVIGDGDFKHLGGAVGMLAWISALTSIPFVLIMFIVNYRAYHREWDRKTTLKRVLGTQVLCGIVSACFSMGIALAYMVVGLLIWYWRINLKFKTS